MGTINQTHHSKQLQKLLDLFGLLLSCWNKHEHYQALFLPGFLSAITTKSHTAENVVVLGRKASSTDRSPVATTTLDPLQM